MFVALLSGFASAAPAASGGGGGGEIGFMAAFKENPTFLALNLVVSALVIALIVERAAFQLGKYRVNSKEFFAQIKKLVTAGNIDRAIKLCDAGDYPTLQLVKAGLTHANKGPDEIDAAMSEKIGELKPQVEKRIGSLWSLANIATLIGLLGTVLGIMLTFHTMGTSGTMAVNTIMIGLSLALKATAVGLLVAIPCVVLNNMLRRKVTELVAQYKVMHGSRA
jgi:TonB-system energizer ExbB (group 2)